MKLFQGRRHLVVSVFCAVQVVRAAAGVSSGERYALENPWLRISGTGGRIDTVQVDPEGQGRHRGRWMTSFGVGECHLTSASLFRWTADGNTLRLRQVPVAVERRREIPEQKTAVPLWPGGRLGQRFRSEWQALTRIGGVFPTWNSSTSGFTLALRRGGPEGEVLVRKSFENVRDAAEQFLELDPPLPPGVYHLEMSDPVGTPGWHSAPRAHSGHGRVEQEETAFLRTPLGDEAIPADFHLVAHGYDVATADWDLSLDGSRLRWEILSTTAPQAQFAMPWIRDGYDTTSPERIVFSHFLTETGLYRPVHQFKRRSLEQANTGRWLEMNARDGFRLRFHYPGAGKAVWTMKAEEMDLRFPDSRMEMEVLAPQDSLPDSFPAFYSSDPELDGVLNQFLYSHGFNFGTDTFPDWKEWQSRILAWSKNPQKEQEAGHLAQGYVIDEEGYVHTWGENRGWPFPHKDEDGDGRNDYDTRHFTTNPCFVLGCANHALWSRNPEFVRAVLPRTRRAMEFMLTRLGGENGLLTITAPGHEGRHLGIGSNYWDILPFGHKDAFTNTYFYASLGAMAELEELAAALEVGAEENGSGRSPEFYRQLQDRVRDKYQKTFWDEEAGRFIGCVDADGARHDYGFTFLNTEAAAYGLATPAMVRRIYRWMEEEPTASGQADTYSRWIFAPRSSTIFNPPHGVYNLSPHLPDSPKGSWWHFGWRGTDYEVQCQSGGAILYTSYYDVMARARHLGADNAWQRFRAVLDRYALPDHLSGGSPLFLGEQTQHGPNSGNVGVEGEFPESGLVPSSFLYAFLGLEPKAEGLRIRPNLPAQLEWGGVKHLSFGGRTWDIRVANGRVSARSTDEGEPLSVEQDLNPTQELLLRPDGTAEVRESRR